jgi:hypothetical protein
MRKMKKIHLLFHDAGGGHRNAAVALQAVIAEQNRPWNVGSVQFQQLTDKLDVLRKLTGIRIEEQYNSLLRHGWTLGSKQLLRVLQTTIRVFHKPLVKLLGDYFRENPADLLVSVIPHFNREIGEAWTKVYPGRPFMTIITDFADYPPHFWIEPMKEQHVICGTERAVQLFEEQSAGIAHGLYQPHYAFKTPEGFKKRIGEIYEQRKKMVRDDLGNLAAKIDQVEPEVVGNGDEQFLQFGARQVPVRRDIDADRAAPSLHQAERLDRPADLVELPVLEQLVANTQADHGVFLSLVIGRGEARWPAALRAACSAGAEAECQSSQPASASVWSRSFGCAASGARGRRAATARSQ